MPRGLPCQCLTRVPCAAPYAGLPAGGLGGGVGMGGPDFGGGGGYAGGMGGGGGFSAGAESGGGGEEIVMCKPEYAGVIPAARAHAPSHPSPPPPLPHTSKP